MLFKYRQITQFEVFRITEIRFNLSNCFYFQVIRQFGGEVETQYHPRISHLLCKTQDSAISAQALREGKRLVTVFWLNDIVVKKNVLPPWKAIHFPLPAKYV